jgi:hypothetical protein
VGVVRQNEGFVCHTPRTAKDSVNHNRVKEDNVYALFRPFQNSKHISTSYRMHVLHIYALSVENGFPLVPHVLTR